MIAAIGLLTVLFKALALVTILNGLITNAIVWKACCSGLSYGDSDDDAVLEDFLVISDRDQIHLGRCQELWMHMYEANKQAPQGSSYCGNDAYSIFHNKQIFTITDGGSSSQQTPFSIHSVSRNLARTIMMAFSRTSDWRDSMSTAIANLQMRNVEGATTAMVVRKLPLTHRNVVAVYNLGDARVAHLRRIESTTSYRVLSATEAQKTGDIPYQISGNEKIFKASGVEDMQEYNFEVRKDDLIIGASNGLWDVVKDTEVVQFANRVAVDALALSLAKFASSRKPKDDVTVIVGHLTPEPPLQSLVNKDNYKSLRESLIFHKKDAL